jgi:hypothetical protein
MLRTHTSRLRWRPLTTPPAEVTNSSHLACIGGRATSAITVAGVPVPPPDAAPSLPIDGAAARGRSHDQEACGHTLHAAAAAARRAGRVHRGADGRRRGRRFEHRELHVVVGVGHFLHLEAPSPIAQRILADLTPVHLIDGAALLRRGCRCLRPLAGQQQVLLAAGDRGTPSSTLIAVVEAHSRNTGSWVLRSKINKEGSHREERDAKLGKIIRGNVHGGERDRQVAEVEPGRPWS